MTDDERDELNVEVHFDSWDGDGTVTVSNDEGAITLDVAKAVDLLHGAATKIQAAREELGWNR